MVQGKLTVHVINLFLFFWVFQVLGQLKSLILNVNVST
jgi:hypothetical protein